jgi:hypothetical protein
VDAERLKRVSARLGDAAIDPAIWTEIIEEISVAAGARGAALLQRDVRTSDIPRTAGVDDYFRNSYFAEGWNARDVRAERAVPLLLQGEKVIIDQDILTPEQMQCAGLYAESLVPNGLHWFAALGFWSGTALWGLTIQRAPQEGFFDSCDKQLLAPLSQRLAQTATLSRAVGRAVLSGMTNALHLVQRPALAIDRLGLVLDSNASAEQMFDDEIRVSGVRLLVRDRQAKPLLDALMDQLRTSSDTAALPTSPVVVRRHGRAPVVLRILPVDGAARTHS